MERARGKLDSNIHYAGEILIRACRQVYVEFATRQAATAAKHFVDKVGTEAEQPTAKKVSTSYWNPGVNPFRTLPKDAPARGKEQQPRPAQQGSYNDRGGYRGRGGMGGRGHMGQNNFNRNYNNNNMGYNNMGGGGFNGPMGGGNFGGFNNRGNMMGGMRGAGNMRGGRGGNMMPMNPMGMPMGMPGAMNMGMMGPGMPGTMNYNV